MNAPSASYVVQPFLATDVVGFVLALAAVLYVALWLRDHEPGMAWFALAMGIMAAWTATTRSHVPTDQFIPPNLAALAIPAAFAALARGLVDYLNTTPALRRFALWSTMVFCALFSILYFEATFAGAHILRIWPNLLGGATFISLGALAWAASRTERGAGHAFLALALWGMPAISLWMAATDINSVALRYWGQLPLLVLALTLLTTSLLRRRRALESEVARRSAAEAALISTNASLEAKVAQRTAELQQIVSGLETFNRSVSHDLRGSLGGIAGGVRMALDALKEGNEAFAYQILPLIALQADNSTRLVTALLELARVGDVVLERQTVDLRKLVNEVLQQIALARGDSARPSIEVGEMPLTNADPDLLQRVFANLIGNAIKFTRDVDGGRVDIDAVASGDEIVVSVRDNGVGFDSETASQMFDPFVRLHDAGYEGHGVGLSIVRRAVERHGGRVWAESQPGRGAAFHFSLPA